MQVCNCLVAIAGDLNNKGVMTRITPAEIEALRLIHGQGSISDVEIVGKMHPHEYSHEDIYFQLRGKYPKYEHLIQGYWRDNGARLPVDVRELDLPADSFRMPVDLMIERINGAKAGEPAVAAKPGRKPKAAKPEPTPVPTDLEFDEQPLDEE